MNLNFPVLEVKDLQVSSNDNKILLIKSKLFMKIGNL